MMKLIRMIWEWLCGIHISAWQFLRDMSGNELFVWIFVLIPFIIYMLVCAVMAVIMIIEEHKMDKWFKNRKK